MKKIVLICDRCGDELPNKDSTDIYNGILVKTDFSRGIDPNDIRRREDYSIKMVSYTITNGDGASSRSDDERVHFCDKCKDEFVKFFNAPFLEAENDKREKAKLAYDSYIVEYMKEQTTDCFKEEENED